MKTLAIVLASLLFVSLRLFAGEVGETKAPCKDSNQGQRAPVEKEVKKEDKKEESKELKGNAR